MIVNNNSSSAFNNFLDMSSFAYKILETLLIDSSEETEMFWKILKYSTANCLEENNLSYDDKLSLVWTGDSIENNYSVFMKPLIGSSLDTAEAQTQIRIFRNSTSPTNAIEAIISFEIDFITNEKSSLVNYNGIIVERTDLMESLFLSIMNGRDIEIGSGFLSFDRTLTRNCNSQLSIGNSKSFYGRSLIMALNYISAEVGGNCG